MTCLACGENNVYGIETCTGCKREFVVFPPHVKPNHVCQLQHAMRECRGGRLGLEEFGDAYGRFAELSMGFQDRWKLQSGPSLVERLSEPVKEAFQPGVVEIEQGIASLELALAQVDQALETGDLSVLEQADELLTDFFKISCGGCAILIEELEKKGPSDGSGSMLDVKDE